MDPNESERERAFEPLRDPAPVGVIVAKEPLGCLDDHPLVGNEFGNRVQVQATALEPTSAETGESEDICVGHGRVRHGE